ncbi:Lrp/AsnC family transcriptional regulator [Bacillus solimangrovi]|uniref:Transcriptional regulator n=1 Tax=Bacillus solimangrovi TaxID=1305675 RepID=A0A1E5LC19_9BACI|nr:Lrp/AsnC family transcriptional regulator [Bacillus solimangrovi]OEH91624.1 transcriptional regulator [Bacillus solimangrovi]
MLKLDETDLRILQSLQEDGRRPYTDIAKEYGISEGKVRFRINRMLENGVFEFVIHTNPNKIGLHVQAIIGIITKIGFRDHVAEELASFKEVRFVGAFAGKYDIMIQAYFSSNEKLVEFTDHYLSKVNGIEKSDVFLELKDYKDSFSYIELSNE